MEGKNTFQKIENFISQSIDALTPHLSPRDLFLIRATLLAAFVGIGINLPGCGDLFDKDETVVIKDDQNNNGDSAISAEENPDKQGKTFKTSLCGVNALLNTSNLTIKVHNKNDATVLFEITNNDDDANNGAIIASIYLFPDEEFSQKAPALDGVSSIHEKISFVTINYVPLDTCQEKDYKLE